MIRILHVVSDLNRNGGMMSVIMNYYRNIDRNLIQFDFMSFETNLNDYSEEIKNLGGEIYCLGRPKLTAKYIKSLYDFFRDNGKNYKAIHCHPIFSSEIFAKPAKKYGIQHVIAHSHSTRYSNKKISAVRNWAINLFVKNFATQFMACSVEACRLFKCIEPQKIYILNNAIDCERFKYNDISRRKIRKDLNIKDNEIVIGHIGRFSSEKNHTYLVDIFNDFCKRNPYSKLVLVGDGGLKSEVIEYVEKLNLTSKVIFTGERKDIHKILSALDVFILPSIFEGVPVSAIEAQASGLICFLSSAITKGVEINNVTYMDIMSDVNKWSIEIENKLEKSNMRENSYLNVKKLGFDIKTESKKLENYYMNI